MNKMSDSYEMKIGDLTDQLHEDIIIIQNQTIEIVKLKMLLKSIAKGTHRSEELYDWYNKEYPNDQTIYITYATNRMFDIDTKMQQ